LHLIRSNWQSGIDDPAFSSSVMLRLTRRFLSTVPTRRQSHCHAGTLAMLVELAYSTLLAMVLFTVRRALGSKQWIPRSPHHVPSELRSLLNFVPDGNARHGRRRTEGLFFTARGPKQFVFGRARAKQSAAGSDQVIAGLDQ
jgi:hypothetical protein